MPHSLQTLCEPAPVRFAQPRPGRPFSRAAALAVIADAEWEAERYHCIDKAPVSLATAPAAALATRWSRVPAGFDPEHPLMGPHPTD